jgi:hypothetical protein
LSSRVICVAVAAPESAFSAARGDKPDPIHDLAFILGHLSVPSREERPKYASRISSSLTFPESQT